jgi:hypothetical protein
LEIGVEVVYYATIDQPSSTQSAFLFFLLFQPILYMVYYILSLSLFLCLDVYEKTILPEAILSIVFRAPVYALLAELKLLMTGLNFLARPTFYDLPSDRLKSE